MAPGMLSICAYMSYMCVTFGAGVSSQPALKLPAFASPVTAVAFAPASCSSCSPQSSDMDVLGVGLESGALQLWGLQRHSKGDAVGYAG